MQALGRQGRDLQPDVREEHEFDRALLEAHKLETVCLHRLQSVLHVVRHAITPQPRRSQHLFYGLSHAGANRQSY